jgi:hypothetical protein
MIEKTDALTPEMLDRTSCSRLTIWEDACIEGLVIRDPKTCKVSLIAKGAALLSRRATHVERKSRLR